MKFVLVLLLGFAALNSAATQSQTEFLQNFLACGDYLRDDLPRVNPLAYWVVEVPGELQFDGKLPNDVRLGQSSPPNRANSSYFTCTTTTAGLEACARLGLKARVYVEIFIEQKFRGKMFARAQQNLEEAGFVPWSARLTAAESLVGSVSPVDFKKLALQASVNRIEQGWYFHPRSNQRMNYVHVPQYTNLVYAPAVEFLLTAGTNDVVAGHLFYTGGLDIDSRHDGNSTLALEPEVAAYKKQFRFVAEKLRRNGFAVSSEDSGFTPVVAFRGTLGRLREFLSNAPDVEAVFLEQQAKWVHRARY